MIQGRGRSPFLGGMGVYSVNEEENLKVWFLRSGYNLLEDDILENDILENDIPGNDIPGNDILGGGGSGFHSSLAPLLTIINDDTIHSCPHSTEPQTTRVPQALTTYPLPANTV